jgi:hypothetical protein
LAADAINIAFDLASAYDKGSADALAKVAEYQARAAESDEEAQGILDRLKLAQAANQIVQLAASGDEEASDYLVDLADRANDDADANQRLQFVARARARAMMRPVLALKARTADGDQIAAQLFTQAMLARPDLHDVLNDTPADSVYSPWDVQAQDSAYSAAVEVSGAVNMHIPGAFTLEHEVGNGSPYSGMHFHFSPDQLAHIRAGKANADPFAALRSQLSTILASILQS